ncbi:hypothetical protein RRG08_011031 [Elysia crispata]|uniref:Uncharacterized protein n=1 Tax=Elysia crispata TaxID=231223 RepID=A0AAE0YEW2_9GAST|nr:hypothetical protein RRG08_011031 [Elysia crispata]
MRKDIFISSVGPEIGWVKVKHWLRSKKAEMTFIERLNLEQEGSGSPKFLSDRDDDNYNGDESDGVVVHSGLMDVVF